MSDLLEQLIQWSDRHAAVIVQVLARPGSRRAGVQGLDPRGVRITVTEPPEQGKANKAIARELARLLDVSRSAVTLVAGQTSPVKKFLISGVSLEQARQRVAEQIGSQ